MGRKHCGRKPRRRKAGRKQAIGDPTAPSAPAIATTKPEQASDLGEQSSAAAATTASASRSQQAQEGATC